MIILIITASTQFHNKISRNIFLGFIFDGKKFRFFAKIFCLHTVLFTRF